MNRHRERSTNSERESKIDKDTNKSTDRQRVSETKTAISTSVNKNTILYGSAKPHSAWHKLLLPFHPCG